MKETNAAIQKDLGIDPLLNTAQSAEVLGTEPSTLKQSRYTGILLGRPTPIFIKMGRSTRYKLSALLEFRDQFPEYRNTSEMVQHVGGSEDAKV
ncbi:MAG: hypothetical protein QGI68_16540 [Pseudomonadales bacterium]|jgi:hypothetical protein|nr:hypothetical protein [Pseudomonadales bacterium]MDP7597152.1 hypothetical protein [Pseudomonadales bacterium]